MSNREKIHRLEAAGVDETTIAQVLQAELNAEYPYAEIRSKLRNPQEHLSSGARQEIFYNADLGSSTAELIRKYRTTAAEVYKATRIARARKDRPVASLVIEAYKRLGTLSETMQELDTSKRHVTGILREAGLMVTLSSHDEPMILRLLQAGVTYQEIHETVGTNTGVIGRIARANGLGRQKQRKNMSTATWTEILEYAEEHNVSEAARKYSVERSNIYYHRKKAS